MTYMNYRVTYTIGTEFWWCYDVRPNQYQANYYTTADLNDAHTLRSFLEENGGKAGKYHVKEFTS